MSLHENIRSLSIPHLLRCCKIASVLTLVFLVALKNVAHCDADSDATGHGDDPATRYSQALSTRSSTSRKNGPAATGNTESFDYSEPNEGHGVPCTSDTCSSRELKRQYVYETIRNDILRKLRFTAEPNITRRPTLPEIPELQDTIRRMCNQKDVSCSTEDRYTPALGRGSNQDDFGDNDQTDDFAQTLKVLLFPVAHTDHSTGGSGRTHNQPHEVIPTNVARFKIPAELHNSEIVNATFGVYVRSPSTQTASRRPTFLLVYGRRGAGGADRQYIGKRVVNLTASSGHTDAWYQIKVNPAVIPWLSRPSAYHDFEVQVTDHRGFSLAVIEPRNDDEQPFRPYLEIQVRAARQTARSKRQLDDLNCDDLSLERRCCRYPLVVDFDEFGWDWVIVPRRYSAYYCSGECPFLYYRSSDAVGSHARQQQVPAGGGGPCCSPKKVSAISMLYYDDEMNILHGRLPGMVVEQCGCS